MEVVSLKKIIFLVQSKLFGSDSVPLFGETAEETKIPKHKLCKMKRNSYILYSSYESKFHLLQHYNLTILKTHSSFQYNPSRKDTYRKKKKKNILARKKRRKQKSFSVFMTKFSNQGKVLCSIISHILLFTLFFSHLCFFLPQTNQEIHSTSGVRLILYLIHSAAE